MTRSSRPEQCRWRSRDLPCVALPASPRPGRPSTPVFGPNARGTQSARCRLIRAGNARGVEKRRPRVPRSLLEKLFNPSADSSEEGTSGNTEEVQMPQRKSLTRSAAKAGKKVLAADTTQRVISAVADEMEEVVVDKADDAAEAIKEKAARAGGRKPPSSKKPASRKSSTKRSTKSSTRKSSTRKSSSNRTGTKKRGTKRTGAKGTGVKRTGTKRSTAKRSGAKRKAGSRTSGSKRR
jgi:hypothetical protein